MRYTWYLSLEDADNKQSNFATEFKNLDKGKKNWLFQVKNSDKIPTSESSPELATEPIELKKSKLKLQQEFMNETIADKEDMNEIFGIIFKCQNPSFLAKATNIRNEQLVNNINDELIDLRNAFNKK